MRGLETDLGLIRAGQWASIVSLNKRKEGFRSRVEQAMLRNATIKRVGPDPETTITKNAQNQW